MTLDAEQMRGLCRRRDAGVVAAAASTDELAARLMAGVSPLERQALVEDGRAARQEMIEGNLGLVRFAVARFVPAAGLDREDYFQEGVLGLTAAVDRYDPTKSPYFSSFALPHIRGAVSSLVSTRGGDLRPSQGRNAGRVEREVARREALGLPISTAEIAGSLQMEERVVVASFSYRRPAPLMVADGRPDFPDRPTSGVGDHAELPSAAGMLFMLPPHERRVLESVHGDAAVGRTMIDIAAELGLSTRQLRGVLDSGHRHLRALMGKVDPDVGPLDQRHGRPRQPREPARPARSVPTPGL
ncbi:sigma-70 family RNA polymerase sigma factor [uncultured Friedmanniella sp.]|uniref:sigma-70 family RNA polymerase sigma factor n=1 Tax=uncultured Friedmanniella sp. TaxID=335381 RepID=UPI0035CBC90F